MSSLENITSFHQHSKEIQGFFPYVCIRGTIIKGREYFLSPLVMKWSENQWIFDLRGLEKYWKDHIQKLEMKYEEFIFLIASKNFKNFSTITCSDHPWKSVLLLQELEDRGMKGFFSQSHAFSQNVLRNFSNASWMQCFEDLVCYSSYTKAKKNHIYKQKKQFEIFISRMQKKISSLGFLHVQDIQRRFGSVFSYAWSWTFLSERESKNKFPWKYFYSSHHPHIKRVFDSYIRDWDEISFFIKKDLTTLSQDQTLSRISRVSALKWILCFEDQKDIQKEISFSHPLSLHDSFPNYSSFLVQMEFVFDEISKEVFQDKGEIGMDFGPMLFSWKIQISDIFVDKKKFQEDLFESEKSRSYKEIISLSGQCKQPLQKYYTLPSFDVEDCYKNAFSGDSLDQEQEKCLYMWDFSSVFRPLFVFDQVQSFSSIEPFISVQSLESVSSSWWGGEEIQREYYRVLSVDQNLYWFFKDERGRWFKQGVFS
ncbi:MAG: hypothetical protein KDD52_04275 [Bdellovibrionales bacterium]|nr:hypothetical protein [Bdellovibrionales bacterium]